MKSGECIRNWMAKSWFGRRVNAFWGKKRHSWYSRKQEEGIGRSAGKDKEGENAGCSAKAERVTGPNEGVADRGHDRSHEGGLLEEPIAIDWKKAGILMKKYGFILMLLIPIILSVYLRIIPTDVPAADGWATNTVQSNLRNQIAARINLQYPNSPADKKTQMVSAEFSKALIEHKEDIDNQIANVASFFRSQMQDENGVYYVPDIDPYFWMRHARNILDHGYPGDKVVEGKQIDDHMIAPLGREVPKDMFHAYFMAFTYRFLRVFNPDIAFMAFIFYVPAILGGLAVIPAFFLARKVSGNFGGFVAATLIAVHPVFMSRSTADTDTYNILFPLLISWALLCAYDAKGSKERIGLGAIAGLLTGVYFFAWSGWWFIFDCLLAAGLLYLAYLIFASREILLGGIGRLFDIESVRVAITVLAVFFLCSAISLSLFGGSMLDALRAPLAPFGFMSIKDVATNSVWPNVFTTVAEQNEISFEGVVGQLGGYFLLCICLLGIALTSLRFDRHGRHDIKYPLLLAIWLAATIYASSKGVRWVLLIVPPFALAIGIAAGLITKPISKVLRSRLGLGKTLSRIAVMIVICALIFLYPKNMVSAAMDISNNMVPMVNDAWYDSLRAIDENASENAIVNSWWDFGHWFKYLADRPVTFDGTSQDTPMAYWIGNALLTESEDMSIGILRMLDCGSNKAFESLDKHIGKPYRSIEILREIIILPRLEAKDRLLGYGLAEESAEEVLNFSHCESLPENYFITSEDMVGKSGVWAHFGSWDFRRSSIFNTIRNRTKADAVKYLTEEFRYSEEEATSLYREVMSLDPEREANDWIADWPSYMSGVAPCQKEAKLFRCSNGFLFDPLGKEAYVNQDGRHYPAAFAWQDSEGFHVKNYTKDLITISQGSGVGIVFIPAADGGYSSIMMHPRLVGSMFTRLFYLDGYGLDHFDKFNSQRSFTNEAIVVWKVDWDGK